MNQVSTTTNAAGALTPRPALARGVAVSSGLRSLMDLVQSDQPPQQAAEWRGTAIVSVLGQLAATAPATSEQLLNSCCGVAKQRRSVAGIEPILLSALLGAPEQSPSLAIADATWAALPAGHFADDELFPILDPIVGDVCFLSGADIGSLTGLALRAQLAALCNSHATAAGAVADETSFAAAVLLAAATVVSAALLAPLSDSSPQKSAALAALPANGDSGGLPPALVRGGALFVQTCLIKDNGDTFGPPTQPWKSLWPRITTLRAGDPAEAVRHPYWKPSQLCPALPTTGPGLNGQVLHHGETLLLQSVPQVGFDGALLRQGFYPSLSQDPPSAGTGSWRWQIPTSGTATPTGGMDVTPHKIIGGPSIHPLTGGRIDPWTFQPLPGHRGPSTAGALRQRLTATVRAAGLSTSTPVGDVIDRLVQSDYDLASQ